MKSSKYSGIFASYFIAINGLMAFADDHPKSEGKKIDDSEQHGSQDSSTALYGAWPSANNGAENLGIGHDKKLNASNVGSLQPVWSTMTCDPLAANVVQSNPVIADGIVYVAQAGGSVTAYPDDFR